MEIARKMYPFVAALFVLVVAAPPNEVEAQGGGPTCGWCIELWIQATLSSVHGFPGGGDQCGWPNPGPAYQCSRCGGTSSCHGLSGLHSNGPCHMRCGEVGLVGGEIPMLHALSNAASDIWSALDAVDPEKVAETIASPRDEFSVEYLPEAGRIDLILACAPSIPAATIPVPTEIRSALDRALKEPVAAAIASRGTDALGTQALEE